jgi:hypothetical protein
MKGLKRFIVPALCATVLSGAAQAEERMIAAVSDFVG